jgi:hypothetical protein
MNGGTAVVPNLDSISEFRVLTNNFDPGMETTMAGSSTSLRNPEGFFMGTP